MIIIDSIIRAGRAQIDKFQSELFVRENRKQVILGAGTFSAQELGKEATKETALVAIKGKLGNLYADGLETAKMAFDKERVARNLPPLFKQT